MEEPITNETVMSDKELEMLFQTNTTNFISQQIKLNKKSNELFQELFNLVEKTKKENKKLQKIISIMEVSIILLILANVLNVVF